MRLRGSINIFTAQLLPLRFREHEKGRKYFLQVLENQKIRGETMSGRMTSKLQNLDPNNVSLKKLTILIDSLPWKRHDINWILMTRQRIYFFP